MTLLRWSFGCVMLLISCAAVVALAWFLRFVGWAAHTRAELNWLGLSSVGAMLSIVLLAPLPLAGWAIRMPRLNYSASSRASFSASLVLCGVEIGNGFTSPRPSQEIVQLSLIAAASLAFLVGIVALALANVGAAPMDDPRR